MGVIIRAIANVLRQAYQRVFSRRNKPKPTIKPTKIQGHKSTPANQHKAVKSRQDTNTDPEKQTFFTDRIEAEGTKPMRKFYAKHRDRLRNQDPNIDQSQGLDR